MEGMMKTPESGDLVRYLANGAWESWGVVLGPVDPDEPVQLGLKLRALERWALRDDPGWWCWWYDVDDGEITISYVTQENLEGDNFELYPQS